MKWNNPLQGIFQSLFKNKTFYRILVVKGNYRIQGPVNLNSKSYFIYSFFFEVMLQSKNKHFLLLWAVDYLLVLTCKIFIVSLLLKTDTQTSIDKLRDHGMVWRQRSWEHQCVFIQTVRLCSWKENRKYFPFNCIIALKPSLIRLIFN